MDDCSQTLVVMVKAPVGGAVKTRLARRVGSIEALRFYRVATARLLRRVGRDSRWRTVLAVTPDRAVGATSWPRALPRTPQGRGDLGSRMQRLFARKARGPVVIVGSDIPDVTAEHVAQAFRLLGRHALVFGPAEDGGYWLVGARRRPHVPRPFGGVRWSTENALADTLRNIGSSVGFVETLADVDTEADWRRWRREDTLRRAAPLPIGAVEPGRRGA